MCVCSLLGHWYHPLYFFFLSFFLVSLLFFCLSHYTYRVKFPERHTRSPELLQMIVSLLKNKPQERPSTYDILNHPYIRKLRHDREKKVSTITVTPAHITPLLHAHSLLRIHCLTIGSCKQEVSFCVFKLRN